MHQAAPLEEGHKGKVFGDGHCVAYVREVTTLGHTSTWRCGPKVRNSAAPEGTIIATFGGDPPRYQNKTDGSSHTAVLLEETPNGLRVLDQWLLHPVQERVIRFKGGQGKPVDDGDQYYVVETEPGPAREA
jgi:hypothetical protein